MIKNMLQTSKGITKQFEYDGFPLILALFHIVNKSLDLITTEKLNGNTKIQINQYKLLKEYKKIFNEVTFDTFGNNAYHSLNEFIHHYILVFISTWKNGFSRMNLQCDAEFNIFAKKNKNLLDVNKYFLHREIFTKFYDDQFNENTVMDYKSVLDQSFLFTINHFAHLAMIRTT